MIESGSGGTDGMDPGNSRDQAEAMAATRRIMARAKLEFMGDEDAVPGIFTEEDREFLGDDSEEQEREDHETFEAWHSTMGTDPEAALQELRQGVYDRIMEGLKGV
ncbi:hypothetical protein [Rubrobacter aplysinae]|uniref:hypothetical protein n=1 Tax=Rubrobacter aplysinae TaxID=909625 RepID=UPI00064BB578|nr:hypothetical protein [Rubrobacter aplysinae]